MSAIERAFDRVYSEIREGDIEIELGMIIANTHHPDFIRHVISVPEAENIARELLERAKVKHLEQSIRFTKNVNKLTEIKELHFIEGELDPSKRKIFTKRSILPPMTIDAIPGYKLKFSVETPSENEFKGYEQVFIRLRESILDYENWRIDITIRNSLGITSKEEIKRIRTELFSGATSVLDKLHCGKLEIEFEYTGQRIHEEDLKILDIVLSKSGGKDINILDELRRILHRNFNELPTIKKLTISPIEFNREMYYSILVPELQRRRVYVSDKIDGMHVIVYIIQNKCTILSNKQQIEKNIETPMEKTIIDAEYLNGIVYMFDIMLYRGTNISTLPFSKRYNILKSIRLEGFITKEFVRLDDYKNQLVDFYERKREYDIDGLIFVVDGQTYNGTKCYKWKPIEKSTIDFLVRRAPNELLGISPYINREGMTLYFLFVAINYKLFTQLNMTYVSHYKQIFPSEDYNRNFPIQFSPSNKPFAYLFWSAEDLDNKIVELTYETILGEWHLYKVREDRTEDVRSGNYFGNFYSTAESIWFGYFNPLTIEDLTKEQTSYFMVRNSTIHKKIRMFNSSVKNGLFRRFAGANWVMDLGAGRGQDLRRYVQNNVKNLLCIEKDRDAVMEIIRRKNFTKYDTRMSVFIQVMDLLENYKTNIEILATNAFPIPHKGINVIVCNFAFHYFIGSLKSMENIIRFISHYLTHTGKFIFTIFNGSLIFNLLERNNGRYEITEGGATKCAIKKKYTESTFTGIGQAIEVLLPVSNQYTIEFLVNMDLLDRMLMKYNITREEFGNFGDLIDDGNKLQLTPADIEVVSLYQYYIYTKG